MFDSPASRHNWTSGSSSVAGSVGSTSTPAAAIFPARNASASAAVSTTAPREVLTRIESGFICASESVLIRRSVSSVKGVCNETTSLVESSSSSETISTPNTFSVPGRRYGSWAMTRIRMAPARCAVA